MASCENKYITLLDLSRQAKVITGETACFDGKIQVGLPFSGYPTGVDTGTTVSLGIVSSETAVFSGNTGTTIFDVSNTSSPNYDALFSGYSGTVWTNDLFSGNTSGLTLPITPLSADTQIVGPFWTLTKTGMTGDYVIGTEYTGYSITYSVSQLQEISFITGFTAYSGFSSASQENFSAGTLDYKGPLDYISSVEDATIDGRLTTNKLTVTGGASASTIGYVLTQLDETGKAGWVFNSASASTNTFVTGGTLNGTNLDLTWNTGGSVPSIELSGLTFTGNTSGNCITDIHVKNIHSCSPLNINPLDEGNVYFGTNSGVTIDLLNGGEMLVKGDSILHSDSITSNPLVGIVKGQYTEFNWSGLTSNIISNSATSGSSTYFVGDFSTMTDKHGSISYFGSGYTRTGITTVPSTFYQNKVLIRAGAGTDGMVVKGKTGDPNGTLWFEFNGSSVAQLYSDSGYFGLGLNPDGSEKPTTHLQVGGTGTTGSFKFLDGNEQNGYVLTSDANGVGSWQAPSFTGNTSGDCITDLWLTNLYGCSPLHIEPSGVNNVYIVENGGNVGIGTTGTTEKLHVSGGDILVEYGTGKLISDLTGVDGPVFRLSGGTGTLSYYSVLSPGFGATQIGVRGGTEASKPGYGKQGDGFIYSSADQNGLNIISEDGGASLDDYIRFYAGQTNGATPANTPDIHIQGSGTTRGNVGINTKIPTEKLHVEGSIKMVDGNQSNGYVLTSDANGVGSWAASAGGGIVTGLTTTGTSGPSTLVSGTLNVPEYAGGFVHYLGEEFGGGIIYHLYKDNLNVEHGLIVSTGETTATWQNVIGTVTGGGSSWDGSGNTASMTISNAAIYVNALTDGGFTDWYLPSVDELKLLNVNRFNVNKALDTISATELSLDLEYWSSTERDSSNAYLVRFFQGISSDEIKTNTNSVRAVRAF